MLIGVKQNTKKSSSKSWQIIANMICENDIISLQTIYLTKQDVHGSYRAEKIVGLLTGVLKNKGK